MADAEEAVANPVSEHRVGGWRAWRHLERSRRVRIIGLAASVGLLTLLFVQPLARLLGIASLVAFVMPLAIVRKGFRILVIGLLCVHIGPHMKDSFIHHRGGPIFFALSLIPLSCSSSGSGVMTGAWTRTGSVPARDSIG
jgi:hypothetical protein